MGLDLVLGAFIVVGALRGWSRGFLLQAIKIGGLIAAVYAADPLREQIRPHIALIFTKVAPDVMDRLLWWGSFGASFLLLVGIGSWMLRLSRRNPIGEPEPDYFDQVGGFLLGGAKGVVVAAFLTAGFEYYVHDVVRKIDGVETYVKDSVALKWNEQHHPAERVWKTPVVRAFVAYVKKMGLGGSGEVGAAPEGEFQTAASRNTPKLDIDTSSDLESDVQRTIDALRRDVHSAAVSD